MIKVFWNKEKQINLPDEKQKMFNLESNLRVDIYSEKDLKLYCFTKDEFYKIAVSSLKVISRDKVGERFYYLVGLNLDKEYVVYEYSKDLSKINLRFTMVRNRHVDWIENIAYHPLDCKCKYDKEVICTHTITKEYIKGGLMVFPDLPKFRGSNSFLFSKEA